MDWVVNMTAFGDCVGNRDSSQSRETSSDWAENKETCGDSVESKGTSCLYSPGSKAMLGIASRGTFWGQCCLASKETHVLERSYYLPLPLMVILEDVMVKDLYEWEMDQDEKEMGLNKMAIGLVGMVRGLDGMERDLDGMVKVLDEKVKVLNTRATDLGAKVRVLYGMVRVLRGKERVPCAKGKGRYEMVTVP